MMMNNMQPQGAGMLSTPPPNSGNYSYAQSFMPTVPMTSPTTGLTGMADALINGYSQYQQNQNGATPQAYRGLPLGRLIGGLFGGSSSMPSLAWPTTNADPSAGGLY